MFSYHHVAITVSNVSKSIDFYSKLGFVSVLTWQSEKKDLTITHLKLDHFFLELFCYEETFQSTVDDDLETDLKKIGVRHFGIQVDSIYEAKKFLEFQNISNNIIIKEGRTGIKYFFITDPDKIFIEIVEDKRPFNDI
jgi:glyoxylase I family protein